MNNLSTFTPHEHVLGLIIKKEKIEGFVLFVLCFYICLVLPVITLHTVKNIN